MKNNKGFTLIELLATITILSIIMLIAIPNVIGVVQRNKQKTFVEDAKKFISLAQYKRAKEVSDTSYFTLNEIDEGAELTEGPNGGFYDRTKSYITVEADTYKVCFQEYKKDTTICVGAINNATEDDLYAAGANSLVKDTCSC